MRVPGDTIFSVGAVLLTWFIIRLWIAPHREATLPAGTLPQER
jgi:nitric oxide reductase subunit B